PRATRLPEAVREHHLVVTHADALGPQALQLRHVLARASIDDAPVGRVVAEARRRGAARLGRREVVASLDLDQGRERVAPGGEGAIDARRIHHLHRPRRGHRLGAKLDPVIAPGPQRQGGGCEGYQQRATHFATPIRRGWTSAPYRNDPPGHPRNPFRTTAGPCKPTTGACRRMSTRQV